MPPEDDELLNLLKDVFGEEKVIRNQDVAKNSEDAYTRGIYVPRIDYAVGPFNRFSDPKVLSGDLSK